MNFAVVVGFTAAIVVPTVLALVVATKNADFLFTCHVFMTPKGLSALKIPLKLSVGYIGLSR